MTFLNATLLLGTLAFAIPLVIHLLNKRRYRDVRWGATHLLHEVVRKNHKRMRVEQLLLLLMRIAIPILLGLLMAKPVLTRSIKWLQDERVSTVFVVDDSFSMQAPSQAGGSMFSNSVQSIAKISEAMHEGSDAAVILMGGVARSISDEPTTEVATLIKQLKETTPQSNPASPVGALQTGLAEFANMNHAAKEVIVVSDFQASDWSASQSVAKLEGFLEGFGEQRPSVTLLAVGDRENDHTQNVSVQSLQCSSSIVAVGQKVTVRANIQNFGNQPLADLPVQFRVDDVGVRTTQISVGAGQGGQALFTHTFDSPGTHVAEVATEADSIDGDNRVLAVFSVRRELPIILVEGTPGLRGLDGDAAFLEIAMRPFAESRSQLRDLIKTQTIQHHQLNDWLLQNSKVCVLANVPKLHGGMQSRLRKFVEAGGGLLIFPGSSVDAQWYNERLFENGKGLLPLPIDGICGEGMRDSERPRASVASQFFDQPAMEFFNDPRNGDLSRATWNRWFRLGLPESADEGQQQQLRATTSVLAKLDSGDPWLVEKKLGRGRVILAATPADDEWGNLPALPVYVPLMQRLVIYLAESVTPPNNLDAGEPLVSFLPQQEINRTVRLIDAKGVAHELKVERFDQRRGKIEFVDTVRPGVYRMERPQGEVEHFAVNLSRDESDLELLSASDLSSLGDQLDADVVDGWEGYRDLDQRRRFGTGMWKPLLWVLLAFLFLEVLFQQWIVSRKLA